MARVTLEDLHAEWERDSNIDVTRVDEAVRNIPRLHAKWIKHFTQQRSDALGWKAKAQGLYRDKWEWYSGKMTDERRKELNWEPQPLRIIPQKVDVYVQSDAEMIKLQAHTQLSETKLEFIEDVLKMIHNRGYQLKTLVEWLRFTKGDF